MVILPFALQQSDLPLRPAFPILMANLVSYLAPGAGSLLPVDVPPGEAPSLTVPAAVNQLRPGRPGWSRRHHNRRGQAGQPAALNPTGAVSPQL
ncbi:MAG: hypothetical protein U0401_06025 [Anaerolineae bacterium]